MFALFSNAYIYSLSMNILYWTSNFYILRKNRFLSIYFPKHSPTRNIMMFPIRFQNRTHFDSLMRFLENAKINNDNEILFVILSFIAVEKKNDFDVYRWLWNEVYQKSYSPLLMDLNGKYTDLYGLHIFIRIEWI